MKLSVFVSTMHMEGDALPEKMAFRGDNIAIVNQCDKRGMREIRTDRYDARIYDRTERGTSKSRNEALAIAEGELVWLCDDDLRLAEDFESRILTAFRNMPDADAIAFNVPSDTPERPQKPILETHRLSVKNALRYPVYRFVYRLSSLRRAGLRFNENFGGGAKYSSGEDTLFIVQSLRAGLKAYAVPIEIARVKHEDSSWFSGYTDKYLFDKGALFRAIFGQRALLYDCAMLTRHPEWRDGRSLQKALALMLRGGRDFANGKKE